jgi:hypothetical protein
MISRRGHLIYSLPTTLRSGERTSSAYARNDANMPNRASLQWIALSTSSVRYSCRFCREGEHSEPIKWIMITGAA